MARIAYLTTIDFGPGEFATLLGAVAELGLARPMVVSDRGIEATGLIAKVSALLGEPVLYLDTPPNPTEEAVAEALALWKAERCDGIVALGGGSPIDLAKGVALLAAHDGPLEQYAAIYGGVARGVRCQRKTDCRRNDRAHRQRLPGEFSSTGDAHQC